MMTTANSSIYQSQDLVREAKAMVGDKGRLLNWEITIRQDASAHDHTSLTAYYRPKGKGNSCKIENISEAL